MSCSCGHDDCLECGHWIGRVYVLVRFRAGVESVEVFADVDDALAEYGRRTIREWELAVAESGGMRAEVGKALERYSPARDGCRWSDRANDKAAECLGETGGQ